MMTELVILPVLVVASGAVTRRSLRALLVAWVRTIRMVMRPILVVLILASTIISEWVLVGRSHRRKGK